MAFSKKRQFENKLLDLKSNVSNKHNLERILAHDSDLAMRNHSFAGRLQYLTVLKGVALFKNKRFEDFSEQDLKDFFAGLKPLGPHALRIQELSPKSKWIYFCLVKSFFKWLYNAEDSDSVPEVVRWIKRKKYFGQNKKLLPSEILTTEEVLSLVRSAPFTRDVAFIFALFESGCRVASEFLQLKIKEGKDFWPAACLVRCCPHFA